MKHLHLLLLLLLLAGTDALDNGVATSPPMGWRSWNQFGLEINQTMVVQQYRAMVNRSRGNTSLLDLGFVHAGIDDGWQACNSGPGGKGFHNASGYPNVRAAG